MKKAAAAMCVRVGSFSDPASLAGASHFLEHMLFMGSEAFPDENEYDAFLSRHGGGSNAYTDTEATVYYFDVQPSGLEGGLRRFAGFFAKPLCRADAVGREVQAVESEFRQALTSDACRLSQLRCHTARPGHVFTKFAWGNQRSLIDDPTSLGLNPREELLKYHRQQYSAERMALVVVGAEPLDVLQGWAVELFSGVRSGLGAPTPFHAEGSPFEGGYHFSLPMTREGHELHVTFPLPCLDGAYEKKADEYLSHLVGHEGEGSLLSVLKAKGLVVAVSAGVSEEGYDRSTVGYMFSVTFRLTEAGLACTHGASGEGEGEGVATAPPGGGAQKPRWASAHGVLQHLFAYLNMLRRAGPQAWVWDEMAAAARAKFKFAEEEDAEDYASRLAATMRLYKPEHALAGEYIHAQWDPDLVEEVLALCTPQNMRVECQSSAIQAASLDEREPWFDVPYSCVRYPEAVLKELAAADPGDYPGLALPQPNAFMPTDFDLKTEVVSEEERAACEEAAALSLSTSTAGAGASGAMPRIPDALAVPPACLVCGPRFEFWHKFDRFFESPRMVVFVALDLPGVDVDAGEGAALKLLAKTLEDSLVETTYLAAVAGLHTSVVGNGGRLRLKLEGFAHKLPLLLAAVSDGVRGFEPGKASEKFEAHREAVRRAIRNALIKPSRHATYLRLLALHLDAPTLEEQLKAFGSEGTPSTNAQGAGMLGVEEVRSFLHKMLAGAHVQCFVHGNATRAQAAEIATLVRDRFAPPPLRTVQRLTLRRRRNGWRPYIRGSRCASRRPFRMRTRQTARRRCTSRSGRRTTGTRLSLAC